MEGSLDLGLPCPSRQLQPQPQALVLGIIYPPPPGLFVAKIVLPSGVLSADPSVTDGPGKNHLQSSPWGC